MYRGKDAHKLCHGYLIKIIIRVNGFPKHFIILFLDVKLIESFVYSTQVAVLNSLHVGLHQRQMSRLRELTHCSSKGCKEIIKIVNRGKEWGTKDVKEFTLPFS